MLRRSADGCGMARARRAGGRAGDDDRRGRQRSLAQWAVRDGQRDRAAAALRRGRRGSRAHRTRRVLTRRGARAYGVLDARADVGRARDWRHRRSGKSRGAAPRAGGGVMSIRAVKRVTQSKPALEGAGVRLRRAFGFGNTSDFDPFLMLDDFRNDNPDDYLAGFPWHPHRGIETITYVLAGSVEHGDSLGNRGSLGAGDVQWMTAGRGIMHQEMPRGDGRGRMHGFQLWANLPARLKMTEPRYQDIAAKDIPEVTDDDGTHVRVIVGDFWSRKGPVEGVAADPRYLDVWVPPGKQKRIQVDR